MSVQHHLDSATLLRYASGDLDEAFSVIVASHLAMCAECRHAARMAEEVGGRMLETGETAALSAGAVERLLARLDENAEPIRHPDAVAPESSDVPAPLRRLIGGGLDRVAWKTVAPGVRKHDIALGPGAASALYMLHIAPGKAVPEHGHGGAEMTLILSGAYRDELGLFGPGDIADLDEDVEHQPKVEPGEACICLVATEAPTRFKSFFSRLLQPLIGI
jgi:putative transcriptional regulator